MSPLSMFDWRSGGSLPYKIAAVAEFCGGETPDLLVFRASHFRADLSRAEVVLLENYFFPGKKPEVGDISTCVVADERRPIVELHIRNPGAPHYEVILGDLYYQLRMIEFRGQTLDFSNGARPQEGGLRVIHSSSMFVEPPTSWWRKILDWLLA